MLKTFILPLLFTIWLAKRVLADTNLTIGTDKMYVEEPWHASIEALWSIRLAPVVRILFSKRCKMATRKISHQFHLWLCLAGQHSSLSIRRRSLFGLRACFRKPHRFVPQHLCQWLRWRPVGRAVLGSCR